MILDGGMSNALEELGYDLSDPLWTARVLRDAPEAVAEVHRRYYRAGAQVATSASYQASVPGFVDQGLLPTDVGSLLLRSIEVAREVRDELAVDGIDRWVAASIGPYGAVLADGSEYRGRYGVTAARLRDFHGPRLELLASAGPDLIAVETIPDLDEAEVLADLLYDVDLPTWFSFSRPRGSNRRRPAAGRGVRHGRGADDGRGRRGQLLPGGRGPGRGPAGGRDGQEEGGRLPERRRGVGRRAADLGRYARRDADLARSWAEAGGLTRWLLPGRPDRHPTTRREPRRLASASGTPAPTTPHVMTFRRTFRTSAATGHHVRSCRRAGGGTGSEAGAAGGGFRPRGCRDRARSRSTRSRSCRPGPGRAPVSAGR